ncbi:AraC family transcriptional regulator [Acinetobacter sp. ANC 3882]|uniref:helix-turn-helix domain-containing protein n=1 Tax=Acinetobacter sp. ANC 3882 TaxID=2923423 RepID=UPI001F4A73E2|nr:AraC family transcriptional regulator [Acinetobacter sp. ANC 3882]MCH7315936.1 AraC family transcriptional regulator [Acinetobacter sp. ANC 3882]
MPSNKALERTVPGTYIALMVDVVSRWDISADELLSGSGLTQEQLVQPLWRADAKIVMGILRRALELTQVPALEFGFYLGMQMTITCHGLMGMAAMLAKDVKQALNIAQEFISLQSSIHTIKLNVVDEHAIILFEQTEAYYLDEVIQIALLLGFAQMGKNISGQALTGFADVQFSKPDYFDQFLPLIPGEVRFNRAATRLEFKKEILDLPLLHSDAIAERLAREECKSQLRKLLKQNSFNSTLQDLIYDEAMGISPLTEILKKVQMSERALQRKLESEGTNFRELVDKVRCEKAIQLLKNPNLSLENIASHLGYTNTKNFSRAFKRWTGTSPRRY